MKEYWIKYKLYNGYEALVVMPSRRKLCAWLLRNMCRCESIKITTMWEG